MSDSEEYAAVIPPSSADLTQTLHFFYVGWFVFLLIVLYLFRQLLNVGGKGNSPSETPQIPVSEEFKRFQWSYVLVYLIVVSADWLQGPYVYALYQHYGFDKGDIGKLFIVGFGASLIFGTIVGSMADKYGRKKLCIVFGVLYSLSCITKHSSDYNVLLVGRLLGGIATSILFSSFESWMVHEHHAANYNEQWLALTFSLMTSGNGIVAIAAGVVASVVRDRWGPVAPFDASLLLLVFGTLIIIFTWNENTGDATINLAATMSNAWDRLRQDPKIAYLGIIQSFFEGAMYVFVFMWTPALESTATPFPIYHGWIFASFMICVLIGSGIFQAAIERSVQVEHLALYMFVTAAISLLLPAFIYDHTIRLCCFFVFEICVGLFWPSLGFMRSRYVPEEVRATVMNFFRIPLNMIVVLVLINIGTLSELQVFCTCFACLLPALFFQWKLTSLVGTSDEKRREQQNADEDPLTASAL